MSLALFGVYLATMAPTISWHNGGLDGPELAAAAYTWGVAHPPGYPLYLTIVRLFEWLPFGDVGYRATLESGVLAALAGGLVALTVRQIVGWTRDSADWRPSVSALYAGAAIGLVPLLWSQAVVVEVYATTVALLAGFLLALLAWRAHPASGRFVTLVVLAGLMVSQHPPLAVTLLPAGWIGWHSAPRWRLWLGAGLAIFLIVAAVLASLWLRASFHPALDWGDPTTPARFYAQVTAADYHPYFLARPLVEELPRFPYAVALLARQMGWGGLVLALLGGVWLSSVDRALAVLGGLLVAFFVVFAVLYNARDSERYLLPAVVALSIGAGVGANWLLGLVRGKWAVGLTVALLASVAWQLAAGWGEVNAAGDYQARDETGQILESAPEGGVVHSTDEQFTFALWYEQAVEHVRPDVAVVDDHLVALAWYREELRERYPPAYWQVLGIARDAPPPAS